MDFLPEELQELFTEREYKLIQQSFTYAKNDPAGLPAHNLMIIVAKFYRILRELERELDKVPANTMLDIYFLLGHHPIFSNVKE